MDKKDWTPEELELKEALNKLYETDTRTPSKPLDLSFMNESAEIRSKKRHRRLAYIAAAVLLVFASSFATAVFISNDYASAVQDKIQRKVFEKKYGVVVATDDEFSEEGETVWEITDFEVAKKAKEIVPDLPIPGYMPEGYEFEKLTLHLYNYERIIANYNYIHQNTKLYISCLPYDNNYDATTLNSLKIVKSFDRTTIIWQDPITHIKGASIIYNDTLINIMLSENIIDINELLSIATSLK